MTPFIYHRTVHFSETDAAGVLYFANLLSISHEAYEASLATLGIDLATFFRGQDWAVPIVHAEVNFYQPMVCGDRLQVHLTAHSLRDTEFECDYQIFIAGQERASSQATTRHVCIDGQQRRRRPLPDILVTWLAQWPCNAD